MKFRYAIVSEWLDVFGTNDPAVAKALAAEYSVLDMQEGTELNDLGELVELDEFEGDVE